MAEPGSQEFIELAFLLAMMVGILYFLIGIFRMGIVMAFISHSAVKGFTAAAALITISTFTKGVDRLATYLGVFIVKKRNDYVDCGRVFKFTQYIQGLRTQ